MSELGPRSQTSNAVLRALLLTDLVGSTRLTETLGDERAAEVSARHDRLARELLAAHDGLEIDKTDGFLLLFERPVQAVAYALAYHRALAALSAELGVELRARAGIHLGEVILRQNPAQEVERGAKPIEAEGLAKPTAARVMSLAEGAQTLMTRGAFDLARRSAVGTRSEEELEWRAHGDYYFKGLDEPLEIFEVGEPGIAPFNLPQGGEKAKRSVAPDQEATLGWRPAVGLSVPGREHWLLDAQIGEGGFGEVWLAEHDKTGAKRIFKFCFEAERLRGLRREVVLFRLLRESLGQRQDIAQIVDWQFDEAPYFLEAEYSEGGDLKSWAAARGGLEEVPLADRLELLAQTAVALAAAHSAGVLHKDIKPANVLVYRDASDGRERVRLSDFGIGLVTDRGHLGTDVTVEGLTQTLLASGSSGTSGGTPMYIAPEVLSGRPPSTLSDIYALGVMLYQIVVGDFGRALAPGWEREIDDELLRDDISCCVDGDPTRRLRSADELAQRLRSLEERHLEAQAEEARRREAARFRRRRRQFAVATAAGIGLTLLAIAFGWRERARSLAESELRQAARRQLYVTDMARASEAWQEGNLRQLQDLLQKQRPGPDDVDLRGFEWYHWWKAAQQSRRWIQHPVTAPWYGLAASPDGVTVIAPGWGAGPLVLRGSDAAPVLELPLMERLCMFDEDGLAFSPDGKTVAMSYCNGISLWNTEDWLLSGVLTGGHPDRLAPAATSPRRMIAISPTQALIATADWRGRVVFWADGGRDTVQLPEAVPPGSDPRPRTVHDLTFSTDGRHLIAASDGPGANLFVLDVAERAVVEAIETGGSGALRAVETSSDGTVASAGDLREIRLWRQPGDRLQQVGLLNTPDSIRRLAFSPDGRRLAAATESTNTILVWQLGERPYLLHALRGHARTINGLVFVGDDDTLWSASRDGFIRVWDLNDAGAHLTFRSIAPATTPAYLADGSLLFQRRDGEARLWDPMERRERALDFDWALPTAAVGGDLIAGVTAEGTIEVRDLAGELQLEPLRVVDGGSGSSLDCRLPGEVAVECVQDVAVSRDASIVAWSIGGSAEEDRQGLYLYDSASGETAHLGPAGSLELSPARQQLASALFDRVSVWDVATWPPQKSYELEGWGPGCRPAFSPDGSLLAVGLGDGRVQVYDSESGTMVVPPLRGHAGEVAGVTFTADGRRLVSGGADGSVRIWDLETAEASTVLTGHEGRVEEVAFSPSGDSIASTSLDGTLRLWLRAAVEEGEDDLEQRLEIAGESSTLRSNWEGSGREMYAAAKERFPDRPRAFLESGDAFFRYGLLTEAVADYERAAELGEKSVELFDKLARAHVGLTDWAAAAVDWQRRLEVGGDDADTLIRIGDSLRRLGRRAEAAKSYARALAVEPSDHVRDLVQRSSGVGAIVPVARTHPRIAVHSPWGEGGFADILPTDTVEWQYAKSEPQLGWNLLDGFDAGGWQSGSAPFSGDDTVGTAWKGEEGPIWLRKEFEVREEQLGGALRFILRADVEAATLYLNGVEAASTNLRGMRHFSIPVSERAVLRPGRNVLALRATPWFFLEGYLDVGLYRAYDSAELAAAVERELTAR